MPLKHNLTKYDKLKERMHRTLTKDERTYTGEDRLMRDMATIVASFASSKSWKTHRELAESRSPNFAMADIKEEYAEAYSQKWRTVSPFDISEVMQNSISEFKFEHWLYYNVPSDRHDSYKEAWSNLNELIDEDDGIEEMNDIA